MADFEAFEGRKQTAETSSLDPFSQFEQRGKKKAEDPFAVFQHTKLPNAPALAEGTAAEPAATKADLPKLRKELAQRQTELAITSKELGRPIEAQAPTVSLPAKAAEIIQAPFRAGIRVTEALQKGQPAEIINPEFEPEAVDFGDIMQQAGLTAKLSELPITEWLYNETGEGWKLRQAGELDAYLSSIFGVPANLVADPVNYLSFGTGGLIGSGARVVGKAGAKYLSRLGVKELAKETRKQMPQAIRMAARLSKARRLTDINPKVLGKVRTTEMVADEIARRRAVNRILSSSNKKFFHRGGIQFAGRVIVPGEAFKPVATAATRVARYMEDVPVGRLVVEGIRGVDQIAQDLFRATRRGAARIPGMLEETARFRGRRRYLKGAYKKLVQELEVAVKAVPRTLDGQYATDEYFHLSMDNPVAYPLSNLPQPARDMAHKMRTAYDEAHAISVDLGMLDADQWRDNYHPRLTRNTKDEMRDLSLKYRPETPPTVWSGVEELGKYSAERVFPTIDDAKAFHADMKQKGIIDWDYKPVLSGVKAARAYFSKFADALSVQEYAMRTKRHLGVSPERVGAETFRQLFPELNKVSKQRQLDLANSLPKGHPLHADIQRAQLALAFTPAKDAAENLGFAGGQVGRSFYLLGLLRKVGNMKELEDVLDVGLKAFEGGHIDSDVYTGIRKLIGETQQNAVTKWNAPYGQVRLKATKLGAKDETWWLPQDVADDFHRAIAEGEINPKDPRVREIIRGYDMITSAAKGLLTGFPSTVTRNIYNNFYEQMMDSALSSFNNRRTRQVVEILRGIDGTLKTPLRRYTHQEVRQYLKESVITDAAGLFDAPAGENVLTRLASRNPFNRANGLAENYAKALQFVTHLERGLSPSEAAMRVEAWLFDYDNLSPFEKIWGRRLRTFYTWPRKNLELQARLLLHRPGLALAYERLGDQDRGPERDALPQYLAGEFKIRLKKEDGVTYVHGLDLPMRIAAEELWKGDVESTLRGHLSSVNYFITLIGQGITQQNWYTGRDFPAREQLDGVLKHLKSFPKPIRDYFEFREDVGPDGEPVFTINGTKYFLYMKAAGVGRLSGMARRAERDPGLARFLVDMFTGIQTKELDMTQIEEQRLRNQVKQIDEALIRAGSRKEYKSTYVPKTVKEQRKKKGLQ